MKTRITVYEFVTKENGRARYIDNPFELPDDAYIAKVKVIKDAKSGREISRDQVVRDSAWMTVKEYSELKL